MTKREAGQYLAAMIDGEGHVREKDHRNVSVANTDIEIVSAVVECCELLALHHRVSGPRTIKSGKPVWEVTISTREALEKVRRSVPIRCSRKAAAIDRCIAAYTQVQRPPQEWLVQKYVEEGLTLQQCAEAWGVKHSASAHGWMLYYGIPRREATATQTKYPPPDAQWLREQVAQGKTLKAIGLSAVAEGQTSPALGLAPVANVAATVSHWCKKNGIKR